MTVWPLPVTHELSEMDDPLVRFLASFGSDKAPSQDEVQRRVLLTSAPKQARQWDASAANARPSVLTNRKERPYGGDLRGPWLS
jgi:hypothetical protein